MDELTFLKQKDELTFLKQKGQFAYEWLHDIIYPLVN
jgi:hypothetical protein